MRSAKIVAVKSFQLPLPTEDHPGNAFCSVALDTGTNEAKYRTLEGKGAVHAMRTVVLDGGVTNVGNEALGSCAKIKFEAVVLSALPLARKVKVVGVKADTPAHQ
jgi:hypothetical protein